MNRKQRYELKFIIHTRSQENILARAKSYLKADSNTIDSCYRVSSIYYDSPDKKFYEEKIDGIAERLKIRMRWYGKPHRSKGLTDHNCFLEIKHRLNECVSKDRIDMSAEQTNDLILHPEYLGQLNKVISKPYGAKADAVDLIETKMAQLNLRPSSVITYYRQAWCGTFDDDFRLTFDMMPNALRPSQWKEAGHSFGRPLLAPGFCVMEVKFNQQIPRWMKSLIQIENLELIRFSKYAKGVDALARPVFH